MRRRGVPIAMRLAGLVLAGCAHAALQPVCDDLVPPAPGPYPVRPTFRSATGGPVHVHHGARAVDVPYAPTLTLRGALRIAGEPPVPLLALVRDDRTYELPGVAIADGTEPDPVLAPGDTIVIPEDLCSAGICD